MELAARLIVGLAAMAALSSPLRAQEAEAHIGHLIVSGANARATPPGAAVGAIYFTIQNTGATADALESVSTPAARSVQLHVTNTVNGVMQMREVKALDCPAGATVKAESGGLHVMLIGLAAPLTLGTTLDVSLRFRAAGVLTLKVPVT